MARFLPILLTLALAPVAMPQAMTNLGQWKDNSVQWRDNTVYPMFRVGPTTELFNQINIRPGWMSQSNLPTYQIRPAKPPRPPWRPLPGVIKHPGNGWHAVTHPSGDLFVDGLRNGFMHYNTAWNANNFFFSSYAFTPNAANVIVPSPWYYYMSLPPYIDGGHVIFQTGYRYNWVGAPYQWRQNAEIDTSIAAIVASFQFGDRRAINHLVPRGGDVDLLVDYRYMYSVPADDFFDIFLDGVVNVRSRGYLIQQVFVDGNSARVVARHDFIDPWGRWQSAIHTYYLEFERGRYVIRAFGVSN